MGGIIGLADNIDKGYVRGCVGNSPKIDNKISDSTGGIIGRLNQFDCATCENLINYGEISGANYTGGIIGDIHEEGKAKNFYLKNAVNVGKVTGTGQVGGCVGHYWASGILNLGIETIHYILYCANYGEVNGSNGGNVGGIIGYFNARKACSKPQREPRQGLRQRQRREGGRHRRTHGLKRRGWNSIAKQYGACPTRATSARWAATPAMPT